MVATVVPFPAPSPDLSVVALLQHALRLAEAGELVNIGLAGVSADGSCYSAHTVAGSMPTLFTAAHMLQADLMDLMRDGSNLEAC